MRIRAGLVQKGLVFALGAGVGLMLLGHALLAPLLEVLMLEADLSERMSAYLDIRLDGAPAASNPVCAVRVFDWPRPFKACRDFAGRYEYLKPEPKCVAGGLGLGWGAEGIAWGSLIAEYTAAAAALLWLRRLVPQIV